MEELKTPTTTAISIKRKTLSLAEKVQVLDLIAESECTQFEIAKEFGIDQSQVSRIKKNASAIRNDFHSNVNPERKRKRECLHESVDQALKAWYLEQRANAVPLNGPILMAKAEQFGAEMGIQFTATDGWLSRWKHRHCLQWTTKTTKYAHLLTLT